MSTPPEELTRSEEVQEQLNFIERVKTGVGLDDDFLAAIVANQVRLARLEQRQLEALEAFRDPIVDFDPTLVIEQIETGDLQEGAFQSAVLNGVREAWGGRLIGFPDDGRHHTFPAGTGVNNRHVFNLDRGRVEINGVGDFQMAGSLNDFEEDIARSGHIWADDDLAIRTLVDDEITGVFEYDQCTYLSLSAIEADEVTVDAERPFNMRAQFSTGVVAPLGPSAVANHQDRFGHINTDDGTALQQVSFIAGATASEYQENDLTTAVANNGAPDIHAENIGQHWWIIQNTEANDAEVQARTIQYDGEQEVADNDIHGSIDTASSNVITVPGNDFVQLESDITGGIFRLYAQAASDGDTVDLRLQYRGLSPSIR